MKYPCDAESLSPVIPGEGPVRSGWILAATILASSMAFIDGTVVNVALPNLQVSLHAAISDLQWVVEAYALFLAALLMTGGAMGDLYGRRLVFMSGVAIFASASIWCGSAANMRQLIFARSAQGIGAALLVPGSLAIISASFPPAERGKAIGTWSGFTGITAAIGPILGGWLVQHYSWRYVFFINVPIAVAVLLITYRYVPETRSHSPGQKLDLLGVLLATLGFGALVFAMIEAPVVGWRSWLVTFSFSIAGLSLGALFPVEMRREFPLIPIRLFSSRNFAGANLLTLLLYAALGAVLFFLPLNLIQIQDYTPTQAGGALIPLILILFFLSRWSGALVGRYGAKVPLTVGCGIAAAGFFLFGLPHLGGSYWSSFFPAVVVLGLGMAGVVAPLTTTVMNAVGQAQVGAASGLNNAISRLGSLLSIAVLGLVMLQVYGTVLQAQLINAHIPSDSRTEIMAQRNRLAHIAIPATLTEAQKLSVKHAIDVSFVAAFRRLMLVCTALALLGAASGWLLVTGKGSTARDA